MARLDGKVALITGAARGQGAAHARRFVAEGARVVLGDVLEEAGAALARELGDAAHFLRHDVRREDDWRGAVAAAEARFGRLDVLVNNAGVLHVAPIAEIELADYMRVIEINQVGCLIGMRTAIPALARAGGGSIVNISSTLGLEGAPGMAAYVASKFAIRGMTKTAALELGALRIRVNSVHPGGIDTVMGRGETEGLEAVDTAAVYAGLPIPRIGDPEEVAALVVFLASDEAAYCTGAEFVVDGGLTAGQRFG